MTTIAAAQLRVGDTIEAQMGHSYTHSRKGSLHRAWSTRRWRITEITHSGTVRVRGVADDGTKGAGDFYGENRVTLIERHSA